MTAIPHTDQPPRAPQGSPEASFWALHDEVNEQLRARLGGAIRLEYCAYFESDDGLPVNNLDEQAVVGDCILVGPQDGPPSLSVWRSEPLRNPTWFEVARQVNQLLLDAGETRCIHFEGLQWIEPLDEPVKRIAVCIVE